ncbi:DUF6930 domain-containing protein [Cyanobacterium aponinum]|uniref:Uncharacterized protein n=1 Tax=Cyanobacterium aponinum 0216 TaxID=2676140 RepID=A0A844GP29_9CHRO|nr:hypothetical protein [Cyanobacterium aponinum]MTF38344.1 hypothetical protein [Cyanobacterium aponinum 0216]
MTSLPESTLTRLQRIPQVPSVWEGDRLPILGMMDNLEPEIAENSDCIIWLDGSEGFVRSMDIVRATIGPEAVVRALLKAMENPHNPAQPARPQKIIVKDRELQFFLRGVLQDLDIKVDYQPELPLLDELWVNFQNNKPQSNTHISRKLISALEDVALSLIWKQQPWQFLSEEEIIRIDINQWNIDSLYACVMGMLGQEFGIILYRSLDSLKSFRQRVIDLSESEEEGELESTFLQQDCWFLNFNEEEIETSSFQWHKRDNDVSAIFGSIHPYEGIRSLKEEEEIYPIYVALKSLGLFIQDNEEFLILDEVDLLKNEYIIDLPLEDDSIKVSVSTMPELTEELESAFDDDDDDDYLYDDDDEDEDEDFPIYDDLIPAGTLVSFLEIEGDFLRFFDDKSFSCIHKDAGCTVLPEGIASIQKKVSDQGFPAIILQTTRPKAKELINNLQEEEGVLQITFGQGYDPYEDESYELGILETGDNNHYIFAQFPQYSGQKGEKNWSSIIENWIKKVAQFDGYCGILIAMGSTGASRGNPQPKDLLHLFYCRFTSAESLGLKRLIMSLE